VPVRVGVATEVPTIERCLRRRLGERKRTEVELGAQDPEAAAGLPAFGYNQDESDVYFAPPILFKAGSVCGFGLPSPRRRASPTAREGLRCGSESWPPVTK
jgi:hypothetical protein